MAEMRICPYCYGRNYSADHSKAAWLCVYCSKKFNREESIEVTER